MPSLDERVTMLEAAIERLQTEQDLMASDMGKLPEVIGVNFRVFRRDIEHRFDAQDRKFEALERKFSGLDQKVAGLDQKVDALGADVSAILDILGRQFGPKS